MKIIYFLLFSFVLIFKESFSQEVNFTLPLPKNSSDLKMIKNQNGDVSGYYIRYEYQKAIKKETCFYEFKVWDLQLKEQFNHQWDVDYYDRMHDIHSNGNTFLLYKTTTKKSESILYFKTIDLKGKYLTSKSITLTEEKNGLHGYLVDEEDIQFWSTDTTGYFLRKSLIKDNANVYTISKYDNKLNLIWEKEFLAEDEKIYANVKYKTRWTNSILSKNGLTYVCELMQFHNNICILQNDGTFTRTSLPNENIISEFSSSTILANGDYLINGVFAKDYDKNSHDGYFISVIDKRGKIKFWTEVPEDKPFADTLKNHSNKSFSVSTKPKVFWKSALFENGQYYLIGEIFRLNFKLSTILNQGDISDIVQMSLGRNQVGPSTDTYSTFEISNFIVAKFDTLGKFIGYQTLKKPMTKIDVNQSNIDQAMNIALNVQRMSYFDLNHTQEINKKTHNIIFRNKDKKKGTYFTCPIESDHKTLSPFYVGKEGYATVFPNTESTVLAAELDIWKNIFRLIIIKIPYN